MRAIAITEPGEPDVLQLVQRERPAPARGEVLIRVEAAGVNRPDVLQRQGRYPVPADADPLPGIEIAGVVVELGADSGPWTKGSRVMALCHGGGYAEYCRVQAGHCLLQPSSLSSIEAAAVPETFFTVWYNLFMRAALQPGETVLVHGGSSGIGTTAIQLAVARGSRVITTAGTTAKCRYCESLGATAVNYREGDWAVAVAAAAGDNGINVVLDMVAGTYLQKNLDLLTRDGRYQLIAFLQGPTATLNLRRIVTHRLTLSGSTLRPQTVEEKTFIADQLRDHVLPLLANGTVRPIVYRTFPLQDAADAHRLMESSQHMGKIVLEIA